MSIRLLASLTRPAALAVALLLAACSRDPAPAVGAAASSAGAGTLTVESPWLRATPPGAAMGAGYAQLRNNGDRPLRITAISSPLAESAMLHSMSMDGGVMKMRDIDVLEVPAHGSVSLAPGGTHLMLMGLHQGLQTGSSGEIRFTLDNGQSLSVTFPVRDAAP